MSTARKPGPFRRLSIGAALLGVAAAPVALALPASAATTLQGCNVSPQTPVFAGFSGGVKQVRYSVAIACFPGRTIEVQQTVIEEDASPDPDDFVLTEINGFPTGPNGAVVIRGITKDLPDTEGGAEEVFQKVRFRVTQNSTGLQSAWTAYEPSGTLTIAN